MSSITGTHKKSFVTGLGASLLHIFCCGAPIFLLFLGIQVINWYLFLEGNQTVLWALAIFFGGLALFLNYRKTVHDSNRPKHEKRIYVFSVMTFAVLVVLLYLSYSTAPYVLPLINKS